MAQCSVNAFRDIMTSHQVKLFPEHLRINEGDKDVLDFRIQRMKAEYESKENHYLVVVEKKDDGQGAEEEICGWAQWMSPDHPSISKSAEEQSADIKTKMGELPKSVDLDVLKRMEEESDKLMKLSLDALGERAKTAWCKSKNPVFVLSFLSCGGIKFWIDAD